MVRTIKSTDLITVINKQNSKHPMAAKVPYLTAYLTPMIRDHYLNLVSRSAVIS